MLILVHNNTVVTSVLDEAGGSTSDYKLGLTLPKTLQLIKESNANILVVWCHEVLLPFLNKEEVKAVFHHKRILASFNPTAATFLPKQIGYIDRDFFIKINKSVSYPTWMMSCCVGGLYTSVLCNLGSHLNYNQPFDYFITSLAKRAMVEGLFCYSDPRLLKSGHSTTLAVQQASIYTLFKFVKQHYKWVWVFFLSFSYLIYEKRITFFPLLKSLLFKQLPNNFNLELIAIQSSKKVVTSKSIDVIIPTIGRKQYLYDVLKDLAAQSILPNNVIIVEQNPIKGAVSELDYLELEEWPFNIKHIFINQTGACNARNIALAQVESEWTFLGDDDNRLQPDLLESVFDKIIEYGVRVATTVYIQSHEKQVFFKSAQTSLFGAGNSFIKSSLISVTKFDMNYEFNYGEDTDFGMQLRNIGEDVVFFADIKIAHLKAPVGGFRVKVKQLWSDDSVQPKPSPTIMLLYQSYYTLQQLLGYKLLLAIRYYRHAKIKNPVSYIKYYRQQWKRSQFWSASLNKNNKT